MSDEELLRALGDAEMAAENIRGELRGRLASSPLASAMAAMREILARPSAARRLFRLEDSPDGRTDPGPGSTGGVPGIPATCSGVTWGMIKTMRVSSPFSAFGESHGPTSHFSSEGGYSIRDLPGPWVGIERDGKKVIIPREAVVFAVVDEFPDDGRPRDGELVRIDVPA